MPTLYLADWPDIYIHTDHDTLQQIDATKLRRVALLGAASGYVYASIDTAQAQALLPFYIAQSQIRLAQLFQRAQILLAEPKLDANSAWYESRNLMRQGLAREIGTLRSLAAFTQGGMTDAGDEKVLADQTAKFNVWIDGQARARGAQGQEPKAPWASDAAARKVPQRVGEFGPLTYQNDNVLQARLTPERMAKIKLLNSEATPLLNERDLSELLCVRDRELHRRQTQRGRDS